MAEARTPEAVAERFLRFSRTETHGSTPLYSLLAERAAVEAALIEIAGQALPGQHEPLMLFAAVHFLLLSGVDHPLAEYYASRTPEPRPPDAEAFVRFSDFCRLHRDALIDIVSTRRAQTNEVNRSTSLAPAFGFVQRLVNDRPVVLAELGTSAGLNLNWDLYGYDFGGELLLGPVRRTSDVPDLVLATELRGAIPPPLMDASRLVIADRWGIDLHPIDLSAPANTTWLQGLVWPEHVDRMERLEKAIRIARRHPPPIAAGDALANLPGLFAAIPADRAVVVFHSFVTYQMDETSRIRLHAILRELSARREIFRISFEWIGTETPLVELDRFKEGFEEHTLLAAADPHGRWLEWLHG